VIALFLLISTVCPQTLPRLDSHEAASQKPRSRGALWGRRGASASAFSVDRAERGRRVQRHPGQAWM